MPSLRPSIYIGIGGTGINVIAKTKKMFEDAYGKDNLLDLPIRFVCIDYDTKSANDTHNATDISGDYINLDNIAQSSPRELYQKQSKQGDFKWFFPQNASFMDKRIANGAKQVRSYGRFLTEMIMPFIRIKLSNAFSDVRNIQNQTPQGPEGLHKIDCHIAMSIAGGTGCGSFLNVAWELQQLFGNDVNLIGYGVSWNVFRTQDPAKGYTPRVVSNAYSALLDLDYLMTADTNNPIPISMNGAKKKNLTQPIYDQFYVIDNVTEMGNTIKTCDELCEAISISLFAAGGDAGNAVDSVLSNVEWGLKKYNVSPKNGWVQGLGACQLIYNGATLADIYADKAAVELIRQMVSSDADMAQQAISWTEQVHIREDGTQYNMLTDSIFSPESIAKLKMPSLERKDAIKDTKDNVDRYFAMVPGYPTQDQIKAIQSAILSELTKKLNELINQKNGVGNAKGFLDNLYTSCLKYKGEMDHERQEFDETFKTGKGTLDTRNFKEFEEINNGIHMASTKNEALEDLISKPVQRLLKAKAEAQRRSDAYQIFVAIIAEIEKLQSKVQTLNDNLTKLSSDLQSAQVNKQNSSIGESTFTIDISAKERTNLPFSTDEVSVSTFFADTQCSLLELTLADLQDYICHFVRNERVTKDDNGKKRYVTISPLPFGKYETYKTRLIDDVIREMKETNEKDYAKLKEEIDKKSSSLLTINDRGERVDIDGTQPSAVINRCRYICHYRRVDNTNTPIKTVFENDKQFSTDQQINYIPVDSDYYKQRIIIYRSYIAVIPYCLAEFTDFIVEKEYINALEMSNSESSTQPHPHFDKQLFEEMKRRDFKLKPEIKNEAMFYWICGNILDFGWKTTIESVNIMQKDADGKPIKLDHKEEVPHIKYIRFYKGKYEYWDEGGNSIGGDKWVAINTADRKNAFDRFKSEILPSIKATLHTRILERIQSEGKGHFEQLINELIHDERGEVRASFDYIDVYAVGNKNSATLYAGRTQEATQYDEEWNYIVNELLNALNNLK